MSDRAFRNSYIALALFSLSTAIITAECNQIVSAIAGFVFGHAAVVLYLIWRGEL